MKKFVDILRRIVDKYDEKHDLKDKKILICNSIDTRNRYKLPEWRTKEGEPLCPIYKDNRCCGSCNLTPSCDHAVDCNCFGYTKAALGGTDKSKYMRKCSPYYKYGRIKEDSTFDWDYYNKKINIETFSPGKYVEVEHLDKLGVTDDLFDIIINNKLRIGEILEPFDDNDYIKINLINKENGKSLITSIHLDGLSKYVGSNYNSFEYPF